MFITDFLKTAHDLFLNIRLENVLDIAIVTIIIYIALIFIKQTHSFFIFSSVIILLGLAYLSRIFDFGLTRQMIQPVLTFFILIFIIVFQREIRRFFEWFSVSGRTLTTRKHISVSKETTEVITKTAGIMAKKRIGALIVLAGKYPLGRLIQDGYDLGGKISIPLLLSIFHTKTPGHDGAVIVSGNRIEQFGAHLPLAENYKVKKIGTRHRAAIGISEHTDSLVIVISEERGTISVAYEGYLKKMGSTKELEELVGDFTKKQAVSSTHKGIWHYLILRNWIEKVSSVILAFLLWFLLIFQAGVVMHEFTSPLEFKSLPKELAAERVDNADIIVTLSGRNKDFDNLNGGQPHVVVDLTDVIIGRRKIELTGDNVNYPSYLEFISITPDVITIEITEKKEAPDNTADEPAEE